MKKTLIATAILAVAASSAMHAQAANVQGGSSNGNMVAVGYSNFPLFITSLGYTGLSMKRTDGWFSSYIDVHGGPVSIVGSRSVANSSGAYYATVPVFAFVKVAQVWHNTRDSAANVYSIRQVMTPYLPFWPQFGGLVVGQVKGTTKGNGVYFGEWAKSVPYLNPGDSTDLNMANGSRTVWYAGDNAVTRMPTLVAAKYDVTGIRQTGVGDNMPYAPKLYKGVLTANYSGGRGTIDGAIARGRDRVDFAGTTIASNGKFTKGNAIEGRFYNNAEALAGIYKGRTAADHVAFGGTRR